ncbi:PREDICTED: tetratricopeptide repeat protein 17 isoform X2 [Nicrophorus vespilloides]|uniref:Tetratricopeptide repeat protein 17 isoform X2 n=1 Tax=Nicrophorus vespilloides TaxID=110193 RepID=A0ABM1MZF9_NICVS|nr:PREDICTED: tetratricopeptide repeat protein 17 isoform X2 [Nicrophorus vespilloides]
MRKFSLSKILVILFQLTHNIHAHTHWVVTENGRIQSKLDSPFNLRRPYDLLSLMDQEKRYDDLNKVIEDLERHTNRINKKSDALSTGDQISWDKCSDITDMVDGDYDMITSNGSDRFKIKMFKSNQLKGINREPECHKFSELHYSPFSYDHLESIANRKKFPISTYHMFDESFPIKDGRQIVYGLMKNSSSWVHYNLGLLYWWRKGNAFEAIECGRRALYYVPREYRDIPLLNLGGLLFWGFDSKDGVILLRAAVDHAPLEAKNYLALSSVYGEMNELVARQYIQCYTNMRTDILEYHDSLQDILTDLHDLHGKQQQILGLREKILWEVVPYELNMIMERSKQQNKAKRNCVHEIVDEKLVITCYAKIQNEDEEQMVNKMEYYHIANKANLVEKEVEEHIVEEPDPKKIIMNGNDVGNFVLPKIPPKYPTTMGTSNNLYFDSVRWPSKDECAEWDLPLKEKENLDLPVFIPLENKGFQINKMLSEDLAIEDGAEHPLPWYPPLCEHPKAEELGLHHPVLRMTMPKNQPLSLHPILKNHFLGYVNEGKGDEAEIGQRILSAVKKKSGPNWVLSVLASMYWRIRTNGKNALACLDMPLDSVPKEFTDVILVSMGSIMQQQGITESALKFASLAFKVNFLEPATNFLLALIHYQKNNPLLAMYYLKNVLRVDPHYYGGEAERLLKLWACRIKMGSYEHSKEEKSLMCGEKDGFSGEGVICSTSGEQCKTAAIQCFRADNDKDGVVKPITKIINSGGDQCGKPNNLGAGSLLSTLLTTDGPADFPDSESHEMHMKALLADEQSKAGGHNLGDFYVFVSTEEPSTEVMLHVYDKSGTYALTWNKCKDIKEADWLHFTSMWQTIAARNFNVGPYLQPLPKGLKEVVKPQCTDSVPSSSATLDHLTAMVLRKRLPHLPEDALFEWLALMTGDQESSVKEIGTKIAIALKENSTSWVLTTAAAFYWRVIGNSEEAITCLRNALTYVPLDMRDIPLISLANVLHRVGFFVDALEVAYIALETHPNYVVNHFTTANIHTSLGDFEKALSFYRSSLALDTNFEPARNRLQTIYCTLLFEGTVAFRENGDPIEN